MTRYRIVPEHSRVVINASSSVHPIHSETDGLEGWIDVDVQPDGSLDLTSPASGHLSLPVKRLRSGNPLEERELKRRIDARRHPTIDGDLRSMASTAAAGRYRVTGDVTFRGVTRPADDEMTVAASDDGTLRLEGSSTFDIRDFGMRPPRILLLSVAPDVRVTVAILATRVDGSK